RGILRGFGLKVGTGPFFGLTPRDTSRATSRAGSRVSATKLVRAALYEAANVFALPLRALLGAQGLGTASGQASRSQARKGRRDAQARSHPASHVDRRNHVSVEQV